MSIHLSDSKWACVAAVVVLGLIVFVISVIQPGGFETGIGWFLALLPGAFVVYPLSDHVHKITPRAESIVFWTLTIGANFFWYWAITYTLIKVYRLVRRAFAN
jgi:hypothetical protein